MKTRAISSQASKEFEEGSETRPWSPERTVKAHERAATCRKQADDMVRYSVETRRLGIKRPSDRTLDNEENALWNGSSTSLLPPWGDFTTALGFDGIINLIATANGTPADQIQTSVGPLTLSHVDNQLARITHYGGQEQWIGASAQEILSFVHLAEAAGSIIRIQATMDGGAVLGLRVTGYVHPITGQVVPIMYSRFIEPGTLVFGSDRLPDGTAALDVNVLPQVELPALEPNEMVQGYVARELAVTTSAIDVHPFALETGRVLQ